MRILIADDDAMARRMLRAQLERLGHQVIAVSDGRQAIDALDTADPPRTVILDWNMPEADGVEVCRWRRGHPTKGYTYLALLTARSQSEDLIAGLEAGADDFLTKPVTVEELRARLNAAQRILSFDDAQRQSRAFLDAVIENIDSGVVLLDQELKVVFANSAFERIIPGEGGTRIGSDQCALLDRVAALSDDAGTIRDRLSPDHAINAEISEELELARPSRRTVRWTSKVVPLAEGVGRLKICRDITRETNLTRALKEQSQRDQLTGLLNRRGGLELASREIAHARRDGKPIAVIIIDIDHFKRVNDTFGHDVGDAVLQRVGQSLSATVRPYDVVMRWGGEEMVVLAPGADVAAGLLAAERIRRAIEGLEGPPVPRITVSAGVDALAEGETDSSGAIVRADRKLYEAKRDGRNRVR